MWCVWKVRERKKSIAGPRHILELAAIQFTPECLQESTCGENGLVQIKRFEKIPACIIIHSLKHSLPVCWVCVCVWKVGKEKNLWLELGSLEHAANYTYRSLHGWSGYFLHPSIGNLESDSLSLSTQVEPNGHYFIDLLIYALQHKCHINIMYAWWYVHVLYCMIS